MNVQLTRREFEERSATLKDPLPPETIRWIASPSHILRLRTNRLTRDLHCTSAGYYPAPLQHVISRVAATHYLMWYTVSGTAILKWGEGWEDLTKAGDVLVFEPNVPFTIMQQGSRPHTSLYLYIEGACAKEFLDVVRLRHSISNIGVHDSMIREFQEQYQGIDEDEDELTMLSRSSRLKNLLVTMSRMQKTRNNIFEKSIFAVRDYVDENAFDNLSLDGISEKFNRSKFYISHAFKREFGVSPIKYIIKRRIERSCFLLRSTNLPVGKISDMVGYDDAFYFSRQFKASVGQAPLAYRKAMLAK